MDPSSTVITVQGWIQMTIRPAIMAVIVGKNSMSVGCNKWNTGTNSVYSHCYSGCCIEPWETQVNHMENAQVKFCSGLHMVHWHTLTQLVYFCAHYRAQFWTQDLLGFINIHLTHNHLLNIFSTWSNSWFLQIFEVLEHCWVICEDILKLSWSMLEWLYMT